MYNLHECIWKPDISGSKFLRLTQVNYVLEW